MLPEIIKFEEEDQIITSLKYYGKGKFYANSAIIEMFDGMEVGDEMLIKILAANKFRSKKK